MSTTTQPTTPHAIGDGRTNNARVVFRVTVAGQDREFSAETHVSGDAGAAAAALAGVVNSDVQDWLSEQGRPRTCRTVTHRTWWGSRRTRFVEADLVEPSTEAQFGAVTASVEVNGDIHEYSAEVSTVGDPFQIVCAAVSAAKADLWTWAWNRKN